METQSSEIAKITIAPRVKTAEPTYVMDIANMKRKITKEIIKKDATTFELDCYHTTTQPQNGEVIAPNVTHLNYQVI